MIEGSWRIQVAEGYSIWDFHVAIQDARGINRTGSSKGGFPMSAIIAPAVDDQLNFAIEYMKKGYQLIYRFAGIGRVQ